MLKNELMNKVNQVKKIYNKHINSIINADSQTHDEALNNFANDIAKLFTTSDVSTRNLETTGKNVMPKVQGYGFICNCGCNVFQKLVDEPHVYKCNACEELYSSK